MSARLWAIAAAGLVWSGSAIADVYQCPKADGSMEFRDFPCRDKSAPMRITTAPLDGTVRGNFKPGTKLDVSDAVIQECFDAYQAAARDPTTTKMLWQNTTVPAAGIPIVVIGAVFTNKFGGPDKHQCWCRLTDSLQFDKAASKESIDSFRETQDESFARFRGIDRALKQLPPGR